MTSEPDLHSEQLTSEQGNQHRCARCKSVLECDWSDLDSVCRVRRDAQARHRGRFIGQVANRRGAGHLHR